VLEACLLLQQWILFYLISFTFTSANSSLDIFFFLCGIVGGNTPRHDGERDNMSRVIFVKPQQWPTPSESIAIYCVSKLVSCVTHLQSRAKVDIWNKKKKLRTVAKIKTQDYKNWRLQNLSTIATPPLTTATTLFNEHRSQRPFGTSDWQNILSAFSVVSVLDDHVVCNRP